MRTAVWIALLVACGPVIPPLVSQGGPSWVEVKTEHFTLWTDASVERGREFVRDLERLRQAVITLLGVPPAPARSFLVALRDRRETRVYLAEGVLAAGWGGRDAPLLPGLLLQASYDDREHMIVHAYLMTVVAYKLFSKPLPLWLDVGLAQYVETADLESEPTAVLLGTPSAYAHLLSTYPPRSTALLFACKQRCRDTTYFATSWLLFSYLYSERHDQFVGYLQALQELPAGEHDRAWQAAFPGLSLDQLDQELLGWLHAGELPRLRVPAASREQVPTAERSLGDADVLAARGMLSFAVKHDAAAGRTLFKQALAIEPTNLLARLLEAAIAHTVAVDDARATVAAHPEDWRSWWLLQLVLDGSGDADEAHARMCSLAAPDGFICVQDRQGLGTQGHALR